MMLGHVEAACWHLSSKKVYVARVQLDVLFRDLGYSAGEIAKDGHHHTPQITGYVDVDSSNE